MLLVLTYDKFPNEALVEIYEVGRRTVDCCVAVYDRMLKEGLCDTGLWSPWSVAESVADWEKRHRDPALKRGRMTEVTVIALSGGKDSTAMALRLLEIEPDAQYVVICTPTGNELPEMFDHWRRVAELLGTELVPLVSGHLVSAIRKEGMIPNFRARWCTRKLKIEPYQAFLQRLVAKHDRVVSCVGIRSDEPAARVWRLLQGDRRGGHASRSANGAGG